MLQEQLKELDELLNKFAEKNSAIEEEVNKLKIELKIVKEQMEKASLIE